MKTRGIQVVSGYLVEATPSSAVPPAFWSRLKRHIDLAGRRDEYLADYSRERDAFVAQSDNRDRLREMDSEQALFKRWTLRVVGPQRLWPWERGWTEGDVDSWLVKVLSKEGTP